MNAASPAYSRPSSRTYGWVALAGATERVTGASWRVDGGSRIGHVAKVGPSEHPAIALRQTSQPELSALCLRRTDITGYDTEPKDDALRLAAEGPLERGRVDPDGLRG